LVQVHTVTDIEGAYCTMEDSKEEKYSKHPIQAQWYYEILEITLFVFISRSGLS